MPMATSANGPVLSETQHPGQDGDRGGPGLSQDSRRRDPPGEGWRRVAKGKAKSLAYSLSFTGLENRLTMARSADCL